MSVKEIVYNAGRTQSRVLVGETLSSLERYAPLERSFIISDHRVHSIYGKDFPARPSFILAEGEHNKNLSSVSRIYDWFIENGVDRSSFVIAVGGGIVCDVAGFAASTYMRGLPFGFVSTTLLSQVDASVGGKNGVNYSGYKNMVGTFTQPEFVICDRNMLASLSDAEYANGLAEILKHALIADSAMYEKIKANVDAVVRRDPEILHYLIYRSIEIKTAVVSEDEREKGIRKHLNFGHSLAHALEKSVTISHGKAVGLGIVFASQISARKGLITNEEAREIENLCKLLHIESKISVENDVIKEAIRKDKKKSDNAIHFVLLSAVGTAVVEKMTYDELEEYIDALCKYS